MSRADGFGLVLQELNTRVFFWACCFLFVGIAFAALTPTAPSLLIVVVDWLLEVNIVLAVFEPWASVAIPSPFFVLSWSLRPAFHIRSPSLRITPGWTAVSAVNMR